MTTRSYGKISVTSNQDLYLKFGNTQVYLYIGKLKKDTSGNIPGENFTEILKEIAKMIGNKKSRARKDEN